MSDKYKISVVEQSVKLVLPVQGVSVSVLAQDVKLYTGGAGVNVNIINQPVKVYVSCVPGAGTTAPSAGTSFDFVAGENIAARSLICVGSDGLLYNADKTDPAKAAIGAVQTAIASGDTGTAYLGSAIITGFTGLTPGPYFLSTAGGIDTTVTDTAGGIIQHIGTALSATVLAVFPHLAVYSPAVSTALFRVTDTGDFRITDTGDSRIVATATANVRVTDTGDIRITDTGDTRITT